MAEQMATIWILHLEASHDDTALVGDTLRRDGIPCEIISVDSRADFEAALKGGKFDVILADYQLPGFEGLAAQGVASQMAPNTPFVFVSGTLGEEIAVACIKAGAIDYVLKTRLERLPASVRSALDEAQRRKARQHAEERQQQLYGELDLRVAQRTAELAAANSALELGERELRKSEARLQAILDYSPAAIFVKDLDGRFVLANRRFEEVFGKAAADIIGHPDKDIAGPRLGAIYRANDRKVLESGRALAFEEPILQDGVLHIYSSIKFPLNDEFGQPSAVCGISLDVTERRHAEEAAKMAALEADRANRAKNDFISRMSHDLRTPLNAILGFAQVLEQEQLTEEQADSVSQILSGGRHLLELINELLDVARIEGGHLSLSPEPVSVAEAVQHVVELVRSLADQHGITLVVENIDPTRHVRADRQRLTQILLNLLSNAVKYNRPNGTVKVSLKEGTAGRYRVCVSDTGYGIPRDRLNLLFHPFERLGAEQSQVEGTGLGLAVAKGLAEAMGGKLGVMTTIDVGSTFWVDLIAVAEPPTLAGNVVVPVSEMRGDGGIRGTVLYIEDNRPNMKLLQRVLRRRPGVTLITADQGSAGLELAHVQKPNLILLDLHLPDMGGEEVIRRLWEDPVTRSVPVVVLSADATPQQQRRLKAMGAVGYLTKPFNIHNVLETVDSHLVATYE
jgi:PAS domain S-box-containing protein